MLSRPPSPIPLYPPNEPNSDSPPPTMGKPHNSLDIVLPTNVFILRGTGVDVHPCWLRGSVVLNLVEPTTIKDITLQFRGKSRLPNATGESASVLGSSFQSTTVFEHDWSFLQAKLTHSPTLKAGRHVFPFDLQLQDTLPSSFTVPSSLSSISYKLHATAVRTTFQSNLHAAVPLRILRSFAPEALEYQQTQEIENTWPEKLMYSMTIPHKAWAVGDTIAAIVKFSPLVKGVRITGITLTLQESIKTTMRTGPPGESIRPISTARYELHNGRAVPVQYFDQLKNPRWGQPTPWTTSPTLSDGVRTPFYDGTNPVDPFAPGFNSDGAPTPDTEGREPFAFGDNARSGPSSSASTSHSPSPYALQSAASSNQNLDMGEQEIVTILHLPLPSYVTPTHSIEPIIVSHRLRFNILMTNPDGHVSELRCSLPTHILDPVLLDDARAATRMTRRLIFGLDDAQGASQEEDVQLPSYNAHIMDRVPNDENLVVGGMALDYVDSQLRGLDTISRVNSLVSPTSSTATSRHASHASSRAASPERGESRQGDPHEPNGGARTRERGRPHGHSERDRHTIFSLKPFTKVASTLGPGASSSRDSHIPPTTPQAGPSSPPTSTGATPPSSSRPHTPHSASSSTRASPVARTTPLPPDDPLCRVPHYDVASRGFSGVTPLSTLRGLPSYEEAARSGTQTPLESPGLTGAERSLSENDLTARFSRSMRMSR